MYENCPQRYYRQRIKKDVRDVGSAASKEGEKVHKALELRLDEGKPLPKDLEHMEPLCAKLDAAAGELFAEQKYTLNERLDVVDWFDDGAWIRVMIDVLIINGTTAVVIDWKNGKRNIDHFQMESTAAQIFMHYPEIETVKTTLVWVKHGKTDPETYTRKDNFNSSWEAIYERVALIEKSVEKDEWPAKPSGLCGWCPAQTSCQYAKT